MCCVRNKARSDGRWARLNRQGLDTCQYPFGTDAAFAWVAGWTEEDQEFHQAVQANNVESMRLRKVRKL